MTKVGGKGEFSTQFLTTLSNDSVKSHGENGAVLASATGTIGPGDFFGILFGSVVPSSMDFTFGRYSDLYVVDGVSPTAGQAVTIAGEYFNVGEYFPIKFTSVDITGSGYVKVYKK